MPYDEESPFEDGEPLFNIGAVSRMTDIPETTLRVWERRYQFPKSSRTPGGHRLYSQNEVARLQWVRARIDEGMQISQAVRALRHIEDEGRFPESPTLSIPQMSEHDDNEQSYIAYKQRLYQALVSHHSILVDQILAEALAIHTPEDVFLEIVSPTLSDIGEAWAQGQINVATEHFATHYLRQHLLMWMHNGPPPYTIHPILLAGAPQEQHEGSLLILGVLLRRLRWPVIYLGPAVPLPDLAICVQQIRPSLVVLVAMTQETAEMLSHWPEWMPEIAEHHESFVTYGGRIFVEKPELIAKMTGIYLGDTLHDGLQAIDKMLHDSNPLLR
ncbi:MAG: MerR family transcriptional regulator [Chloroflexi bacterium]|nr:MAG: hypothetical protein CUN54_07085 [Phototrophicales bacterium]RMF82582.1 MAG: MerR family transcriptional regulator [Chloroflexota bacterium]